MPMHPTVARLLAIPQPEQRTEAWYRARHERLTASDAATALGLNPYESADELVLKKCGRGERFLGNEATAHGERWEPFVRERFCKETGLDCYEGGLLPHPTIPFLGGSPDGLLTDKDGKYCALLEIKAPLRRKITGVVPTYYMPQLQLLMQICDLPEAYFVEFKPETSWAPEEYVVTKVQREDDWMDVNLPVLRSFWDKVTLCRADPREADLLEERVSSKKRAKGGGSRPRKKRVIVDLDASACMIDTSAIGASAIDTSAIGASAIDTSAIGASACMIDTSAIDTSATGASACMTSVIDMSAISTESLVTNTIAPACAEE